jgi:hypothetical protein
MGLLHAQVNKPRTERPFIGRLLNLQRHEADAFGKPVQGLICGVNPSPSEVPA